MRVELSEACWEGLAELLLDLPLNPGAPLCARMSQIIDAICDFAATADIAPRERVILTLWTNSPARVFVASVVAEFLDQYHAQLRNMQGKGERDGH